MSFLFKARVSFWLKLFICLVLVFCFACLPSVMPQAQAIAVEAFLVTYAIEIIGSVLIALGVGAAVKFTDWGDVQSLATEIYNWLEDSSPAQHAILMSLVSNAYYVAKNPAIGFTQSIGIRVSQDLYDAIIKNPIMSMLLPVSSGNIGVIPADFISFALSFDDGHALSNRDDFKLFLADFNSARTPMYFSGLELLYLSFDSAGQLFYNYDNTVGVGKIKIGLGNVTSAWFFLEEFDSFKCRLSIGYTRYNNAKAEYLSFSNVVLQTGAPNRISASYVSYPENLIPLTQDIPYPSDDFLVKAPDIPYQDAATGDIVVPPQSLNPADHTASIPKTGVGDIVDVPVDTWVDVGTGDKVGNGDIPDVKPDVKPEGNEGLLNKLLDKLKELLRWLVGTPSDLSLNFDVFRYTIIPDKFPFCIPFDLLDTVKMFQSSGDFQLRIDMETNYFSIHHQFDMSLFRVPVVFFRSFLLFAFVVFVILKTRDMMKW